MINVSAIDFNVPMDAVVEYEAVDIIGDLCTQIDEKVALACLLIGVCWVFSFVILPRSREGIESIPFMKRFWLHLAIDHLISLFETLALGGVVFIVVIAWIQNIFVGWQKTVIVCVLGLCVLLLIAKLIGYIRRKGWNKDMISIEEWGVKGGAVKDTLEHEDEGGNR